MYRVLDTAYYFSTQVARTRRFYDPNWRKHIRDQSWICLVGGGCEWCAPDFLIDRQRFPFLAFEFVSRGQGKLELAGKHYDLNSGHAFFFDPHTPHVIRSDPADPMVKYFFNFTGARGRKLVAAAGLVSGTVVRVADARRMTELLEEVIDHALGGGPTSLQAAAAALEHALALCAESLRHPSAQLNPARATYLRCRGHLLRNYPLLVSAAAVAKHCGVSAAYMTRLFKRFDKETPLACLQRLKLSQAVLRLRQPGTQVKRVAAELGYKSPAHFSRAFKAWHGRSPRRVILDG
ncbi:MAG: helix-turn-helix transcriptional regulator [Verrucomicrobia bacterium]|nr:helix-turn-helix transcriptional regulator [Verrucomicrobiota bacterium]